MIRKKINETNQLIKKNGLCHVGVTVYNWTD